MTMQQPNLGKSRSKMRARCQDDGKMFMTMQQQSLGKSRSKMVADVRMMAGCLLHAAAKPWQEQKQEEGQMSG